MSVKPINPDEAANAKLSAIPDVVIEAFNEMIASNWDGHSAGFKQSDVVALIRRKIAGTDLAGGDIYARRWLDVEPLYRAQGWDVTYDAPGYCETYTATFRFRRARR